MKRLLAIFLCAAIVISLASGCATNSSGSATNSLGSATNSSGSASNSEESGPIPLFKGVYDVLEYDSVYGDILEGGGYFWPVRFSNERLDDYATRERVPYAKDTVNVRLEFTTDASEISFNYSVNHATWDTSGYYDGFDIYEDGELVDTLQLAKSTTVSRTGSVSYTKKGGYDAVITIFFPVFHSVMIYDVNLGNAKPVAERGKHILVLGDSISQGLFGTHASAGWVPQLCMALDVEYLNLSVGGEEFISDKIDSDVHFTPDLIIVSLGTNDISFGNTVGGTAKAADAYFSALSMYYPNIPIAFVGPVTSISPQHERYILKSAEKYCRLVIDGTTLLETGAKTHHTATDVHPNDEGHRQIAENLLPQIKALLEK